ncbi:MAG TPA: asparagine synthase-related protein [Planctomycetota bacterium]|nr:asparagine synthase-related protein [Planctomycetota bacterium]
MPNLCGIWNPDLPADAVRGIVDAQMQRLRTSLVPYREHRLAEAGFGAGLLDHGILENGPQPVHSLDRGASLFLDGEILNADELRRRFRARLPEGELSPPEIALHLMLAEGDDVVRLFNGHFAIALFRRRPKSLTLVSDRFGLRPIFLVERGRALLFASEMKALAAVDPGERRIDEVATLERFCYRAHMFGDTWMEGYRKLRPATILVADERGVRRREYWRYAYDESAPHLDQRTYATRYAVLLDRAVERAMRGNHRIGIFLSGGYDSRAVAAAIRRHHLPIPAFTFGAPDSRDMRYAKMLSERLGFVHHGVPDPSPYLAPHCASIVWRTDGLGSFANATSINHHDFLKQHVDVILLGFLAEYNGSHTWPRLLLARSAEAAREAVFARYALRGAAGARRIFRRAFFDQAFGALRERFLKSFTDVPNAHPLNVSDSWIVRNFEPFSTFQSSAIDRHRFENRAPLTDAELLEFLLTIPPYARLEQRVYKRMIAHGFPAIRDIPCTNSGRPIDPSFLREYGKMALRYAGRALKKPLSRKDPLLGRDARDLAATFRAEPTLRDDILLPLVDRGIFPDGIFDPDGIRAVVDEHYRGAARHESLLSALISWGLGVKFLLHDDFAEVDPAIRGVLAPQASVG